MTKIEEVARAIHAKFVQQQPRPDDWPTWGELLAQGHQGAHRVESTRELARAAIASMWEPTEAMKRTATIVNRDDPSHHGNSFYRAMIDAALNEKDPA